MRAPNGCGADRVARVPPKRWASGTLCVVVRVGAFGGVKGLVSGEKFRMAHTGECGKGVEVNC